MQWDERSNRFGGHRFMPSACIFYFKQEKALPIQTGSWLSFWPLPTISLPCIALYTFFLSLNVSNSFDIHKQNRLSDRRYYIQHTVILFSGLLWARFMLGSNSVSMFHAPMADYLPSVSIVFSELLLLWISTFVWYTWN